SFDEGLTWTPLDQAGTTLPAGSAALWVRHPVPAQADGQDGQPWQLQVSASGADAGILANTSASAELWLPEPVAPTLEVIARDVGQGEGEFGFAVLLKTAAPRSTTLQLGLQTDAAIQSGAHEL